MLFWIGCILLLIVQEVQPNVQDCVVFDFEDGINDWQLTGDAFIQQPTFGGLPGQIWKPIGYHGYWWVGTYENVSSVCDVSGSVIGYGPQGTLTSPQFNITGNVLTFLIGGACNLSAARAELLVNNQIVLQATGNCEEHLSEKFWDVSQFYGHAAKLRLIDESTDKWGHLNFDYLRWNDSCKVNTFGYNQKEYIRACKKGEEPKGGGICELSCVSEDNACKYYVCKCPETQSFNRDAKFCEDINECNFNPCKAHQSCFNSPGSYSCKCIGGYTLNKKTKQCEDNDECTTSGSDCEQICINTLGSYLCDCHLGFKLRSNGYECVDVDECLVDNGSCQYGCLNTHGSYNCQCMKGYELDSDQHSCIDKNECSVNNGGCDQNCTNTQGSFECSCFSGYRMNSSTGLCEDINECISFYKCANKCVNTLGSFYCQCPHGYRQRLNETKCSDIDECSYDNNGCDHHCVNTNGGFRCECRSGYELAVDRRTCIDINECNQSDRGGCEHLCVNLNGSYKCDCNNGYHLSNDGKVCIDIDECSHPVHPCQQICINTVGTYKCECNTGYELGKDSKSCHDINECEVQPNPCHHKCANLHGSFECFCNSGYILGNDNKTCEPIQMCKISNPCDQNCESVEGGIRCSCRNGYELNKDNVACNDIDECLNGDAFCSEQCINKQGSYECGCLDGKKLRHDGVTCEGEETEEVLNDMEKTVDNLRSKQALLVITSTLDELTKSSKMSSQIIIKIVSILNKLTNAWLWGNFTPTHDEGNMFVKGYMGASSNILDERNKEAWKSMNDSAGTVTNLTQSVELMAAILTKKIEKTRDFTRINVSKTSLEMDLQIMKTGSYSTNNTRIDYKTARVKLPLNITERTEKVSSDQDFIGVSTVLYYNLGDLIPPKNGDNLHRRRGVNSDVMSVKFVNVDNAVLQNLTEPIVLSFQHRDQNTGNPNCSYLDEEAVRNREKNIWSTTGCTVVNTTDSNTICHCFHLTCFAVLMDVHGTQASLPQAHRVVLTYISLTGSYISTACCAMCFIAFIFIRKTRMDKNKGRGGTTYFLHSNLVIAIGFSQLLFIIGGQMTNIDNVTCKIISILLHFFLTASFSWMLVEGINIYHKIVRVMKSGTRMRFLFGIGWGIPLAVVTCTVSLALDKYGPNDLCWLSRDILWIFVGPVIGVIFVNFIILLCVFNVLLKEPKVNLNKNNSAHQRSKLRRSAQVFLIMTPLLGIPWIFGLMTVNKDTIVFTYVFCIFNTCQGLFIFVTQCLMNETINIRVKDTLSSIGARSKPETKYGLRQKSSKSSSDVAARAGIKLVTIHRGDFSDAANSIDCIGGKMFAPPESPIEKFL